MDKGWLKAPHVHLEDRREITLAKQSCFLKVFDRAVTPDMLATIKKVIDELLANRLVVYTASIAAGIDPKFLDWTVTTDRPDWVVSIAPAPVALTTLMPILAVFDLIWSYDPARLAFGIDDVSLITDDKIWSQAAAKLKKADAALFVPPKTLRAAYSKMMAEKNQTAKDLASTSAATSNLNTEGL
uniref:Uncharacterized protein n=1 Tax=Hemiselmis tepida TaxID=464990 RepID=A0A7S0VXS2_9CRYP|mmetsp:Transcript_32608/g.83376  ORF Transcript_32608/g.83376 Transcript_32608/m.83376 type:complete len:185 (+) Transcript_32608:984-1538(+)